MPRACRLGDADSGADCIVTGSPDTYINSRRATRIGDADAGPNGGDVMITGSPDIYINGRKAVRVGDIDSDRPPNTMISGSGNVFHNG